MKDIKIIMRTKFWETNKWYNPKNHICSKKEDSPVESLSEECYSLYDDFLTPETLDAFQKMINNVKSYSQSYVLIYSYTQDILVRELVSKLPQYYFDLRPIDTDMTSFNLENDKIYIISNEYLKPFKLNLEGEY